MPGESGFPERLSPLRSFWRWLWRPLGSSPSEPYTLAQVPLRVGVAAVAAFGIMAYLAIAATGYISAQEGGAVSASPTPTPTPGANAGRSDSEQSQTLATPTPTPTPTPGGNGGRSDIPRNLDPKALPDISIEVSESSAGGRTEGNSVGFKLTATSTLSYRIDLEVDVSETGDFLTGTIPDDIALAANSTVAWLVLETDDDDVEENDGTVTAEVTAGTGYNVGSPSSADATVRDNDDPKPDISIAPPASSVTEGSSIYFKLTATSTLSYLIDLNVDVSETGDYLTGTIPDDIALAANSTVAWLILETEDDNVEENDGTVTAEVLTSTDYDVGSPSSADATVRDNDGTTPPPAPAKVTGLSGEPGANRGEIKLRWNPASRADNYEVRQWRRRLSFIPIYHWVTLSGSEVTIDVQGTRAVVKGLTGGETYRHGVRGIRGTGSNRVGGPWSDDVDTTLALPEKVTGLSGMPGQKHGEIKLSWNSAAEATGYQVRQEKTDGWIELPGEGFTVTITGTTAVVSNLDPDQTYVYQVRGTNVHGEGNWFDSSGEIAVLDERPAQPQGLTLGMDLIGNRGISLSWQAATDARGYVVGVFLGETPVSTPQISMSGLSAKVTELTHGTEYTFRVRAWKRHDTSLLYSLWSDPVTKVAPKPTSIGHQEDHTVAYQVGAITAAPNLPAGFPDPAVIIPASIGPAATAWNTAAAAIAGKNLKICKVNSCGGSNHDGGIVTVKTVGVSSGSYNEACGTSTACVKPTWNGDHLGDMELVIEEPAWQCRLSVHRPTHTCVAQIRIYWTNVSGAGYAIHPNTGATLGLYSYINPVMVHEFGHTLGLPDFYDDAGQAVGLKGLPANMDDPYTYQTPTAQDIAQLRAIYRRPRIGRPLTIEEARIQCIRGGK